jgi:cytochrome P450
LTRADQLEAVRADPTLRAPAIEEALRWEAPVILTVRTARIASSLAGFDLPAGSLLYLLLGSGNRDEHRYAEPDRYDSSRAPLPHLSFGHGVHACPGASLARTGLRVLLDAVLDGTRRIELDPASARPAIRGELFRSPDSLPVKFGAPTSSARRGD